MVATAAFVAAAVLLLRQESRDGRYLDIAGPLGTQSPGAAVWGSVQVLPRPSRDPCAWPFSDLLAVSE